MIAGDAVTGLMRRGAALFLLGVIGLAPWPALAAQDPLLVEFDRLEAAFRAAPAAQRKQLAHQVSDAFLRLPIGADRSNRLASGALATLVAGEADMALRMLPADDAADGAASDGAASDAILTIRLRALARLGRLSAFARIAEKRWETSPNAVAAAMQIEERLLLPLAAKALRTRDRPYGRLVFQYLANLRPVQSYRVANLGLCLRQIGDLDAAFQAYAQGQRLAPEDLQLWNDYGLLLRATGKVEEALAAFRTSVRLDLQRPEPMRGQGPAITNLMHAEVLHSGRVGLKGEAGDPMPTAVMALKKRPQATLLRRLMLDLTLDRLTVAASGK